MPGLAVCVGPLRVGRFAEREQLEADLIWRLAADLDASAHACGSLAHHHAHVGVLAWSEHHGSHAPGPLARAGVRSSERFELLVGELDGYFETPRLHVR